MAHVNQARKATLAAACKAALAKWPGVKWTLSVRNHSTIVMTIASGDIDFEADAVLNDMRGETERLRDGHADVHRHGISRDWSGEAKRFLTAASEALHTGNHDNSDIQSDYFDVGWYVDIQIGRWNKPYACTAPKAAPSPVAAELTRDEQEAAERAEQAAFAVGCVECNAPGPGDGTEIAAERAGWADHGFADAPAWHCPTCRAKCEPPAPANDARGITKPLGPEALVRRANEVATEMAPKIAPLLQLKVTPGAKPSQAQIEHYKAAEKIAPVRANSLLSPIELIGAEQHEADYIAACIGNLTEPVRRGHITIREALERVAKAAFQTGFTAGDRWAREAK